MIRKIAGTALACAAAGYIIWQSNREQMIIRYLQRLPGNSGKYDPARVNPDEHSPLRGKTVIFLGSSVTYGYGACGTSFAEILRNKDGIHMVKEAVSGTTLADIRPDSYVSRLKRVDPDIPADLFVLQLSTNDANQKVPLGSLSRTAERNSFDVKTVCGAIEYILSYAAKTWQCPVIIYTNPVYENGEYAEMVMTLEEIRKKWNCQVIDLWNDTEFNSITSEQRKLYMLDDIHPTKAGYAEWWYPVFREAMCRAVRGKLHENDGI